MRQFAPSSPTIKVIMQMDRFLKKVNQKSQAAPDIWG
jgi:hypothetical protein